jgi:hypothetical protein
MFKINDCQALSDIRDYMSTKFFNNTANCPKTRKALKLDKMIKYH